MKNLQDTQGHSPSLSQSRSGPSRTPATGKARRILQSLLPALCLTALLGPLLAAPLPVRAEPAKAIVWIESCGLPQRAQDYLLKDMLLIAQAYRNLFAYRFAADFHMGIRFFCTPASFQDFLAEFVPEALGAGVIGMFVPELHLMLIDARSTPDPAATLLHETSHAMLDAMPGNYPIWLHEGLAETFESMDRQSPQLVLQTNLYARKGLEILLRQKPDLLDLKQYLSLDLPTWRKLDGNFPVGNTTLNYSRSLGWGLVRFLVESRQGQAALNRLIQNARQASPLNSAQVLDQSWPGGLARLQRDWQDWIRQPAERLTYPGIHL